MVMPFGSHFTYCAVASGHHFRVHSAVQLAVTSGVTGYQFPPDISSPRNWSPRTGGPPLGFQYPLANSCGRTPVLVREFRVRSQLVLET